MDFTQHNTEQAAVWAAYHAGTPTRVPMTIGANERMVLLDPRLNEKGYRFKACFEDPGTMFEMLLDVQYWIRHALPCDMERGLPETWTISPSFQNVYEAAWFGAPIHYMDGEVPDTRPMLDDDNKRMLFEAGIPDPFANLMGQLKSFYEYFQERAPRERFHDRPVQAGIAGAGIGTDGPFTTACNLRGATAFCLELYEDPDYAHALLTYITEAIIARRQAWCAYLGIPMQGEGYGFADDSIALLSCDMYREWILPFHRQMVDACCLPGKPVGIHLCGDATRHFVTIRDALNVTSFDTGFPVDHGKLRAELGPDIQIHGGPHVNLLLHGTPDAVAAETRRILHSGVMAGGKFILREANNLAPRTPMANLQAMYDTCKQEGVYAPVAASA